jgi:hypothetical protein
VSSRRNIWPAIWKATILAVGLAVISPARGPASMAAPAGPNAAQPAVSLVSLEQSTAPLEQYFNQAGGQVRFLALLSPT